MANEDVPTLGGTGEQFPERLQIAEVRQLPDILGDERLYRELLDLVGAMTENGRDADRNYQDMLRRHREDEDFVVLVLKTLDALDESWYVERWALVQLAVDLEHPIAAEYLTDFVQRPIAEEQTEDTAHGLSTVTEEVVLRTTAIEGLARLARQGVDTTDALLQTISSSDYVAMRRAAWFAMVDGGSEEGLQRARQLLDDRGDGWIAELRRLPVREAEQQNPELIYPGATRDGDIPDPFDE